MCDVAVDIKSPASDETSSGDTLTNPKSRAPHGAQQGYEAIGLIHIVILVALGTDAFTVVWFVNALPTFSHLTGRSAENISGAVIVGVVILALSYLWDWKRPAPAAALGDDDDDDDDGDDEHGGGSTVASASARPASGDHAHDAGALLTSLLRCTWFGAITTVLAMEATSVWMLAAAVTIYLCTRVSSPRLVQRVLSGWSVYAIGRVVGYNSWARSIGAAFAVLLFGSLHAINPRMAVRAGYGISLAFQLAAFLAAAVIWFIRRKPRAGSGSGSDSAASPTALLDFGASHQVAGAGSPERIAIPTTLSVTTIGLLPVDVRLVWEASRRLTRTSLVGHLWVVALDRLATLYITWTVGFAVSIGEWRGVVVGATVGTGVGLFLRALRPTRLTTCLYRIVGVMVLATPGALYAFDPLFWLSNEPRVASIHCALLLCGVSVFGLGSDVLLLKTAFATYATQPIVSVLRAAQSQSDATSRASPTHAQLAVAATASHTLASRPPSTPRVRFTLAPPPSTAAAFLIRDIPCHVLILSDIVDLCVCLAFAVTVALNAYAASEELVAVTLGMIFSIGTAVNAHRRFGAAVESAIQASAAALRTQTAALTLTAAPLPYIRPFGMALITTRRRWELCTHGGLAASEQISLCPTHASLRFRALHDTSPRYAAWPSDAIRPRTHQVSDPDDDDTTTSSGGPIDADAVAGIVSTTSARDALAQLPSPPTSTSAADTVLSGSLAVNAAGHMVSQSAHSSPPPPLAPPPSAAPSPPAGAAGPPPPSQTFDLGPQQPPLPIEPEDPVEPPARPSADAAADTLASIALSLSSPAEL